MDAGRPAALERLRAHHGQGVACAAESLDGINLEALRSLSKQEAVKAIELCGAVLRGDAWRSERLRISDEDYALIAFAMSPTTEAGSTSSAQPMDVDGAHHVEDELLAQPQPQLQPEDLQEPPRTVAKSRSRPA